MQEVLADREFLFFDFAVRKRNIFSKPTCSSLGSLALGNGVAKRQVRFLPEEQVFHLSQLLLVMSENAHDFHSKLLPSKKTFRIL
jgi:hypothetical protein